MNNEANPTVATSRRRRCTVVSVAIAVIAAIPIAAGSSAASDETTSPDTTDQATTPPAAPAPSETPASLDMTTTAPEPTIGTIFVGDVRLTFTVPDGWESNVWFVLKSNSDPIFGALFDRVGNIFSDPCQWVEVDPQPGPSVEDLVAAFASVPALNATAGTDITVDGFHGQEIEFTVPDFDENECRDGIFALWQDERHAGPGPQGPNYFAQGPHAYHRLWILDVDGTRLVIGGTYFPDTSQQDLDDLDTILTSIEIDPVDTEPSSDDDPVETSPASSTSST